MTKVLITGDAGFVGSNFRRRLIADGHDVFGIDWAYEDVDDLAPTQLHMDAVDWFRQPTWREHWDLVIHCAAVVGGRVTIEGSPLQLAVADLALDAAMFAWAARTRPGRVVYFSSSAAYPTNLQDGPPHLLHEEDIDFGRAHVGTPDQTYGWVKLTGERLAQGLNAVGVPCHVFRPFSGYGTDQSDDYPFPSFISRALRRQDPFMVWGDGEQVRDFVHIDDIVKRIGSSVCPGQWSKHDQPEYSEEADHGG